MSGEAATLPLISSWCQRSHTLLDRSCTSSTGHAHQATHIRSCTSGHAHQATHIRPRTPGHAHQATHIRPCTSGPAHQAMHIRPHTSGHAHQATHARDHTARDLTTCHCSVMGLMAGAKQNLLVHQAMHVHQATHIRPHTPGTTLRPHYLPLLSDGPDGRSETKPTTSSEHAIQYMYVYIPRTMIACKKIL